MLLKLSFCTHKYKDLQYNLKFYDLRILRDELEQEAGMPLPELSMGMSHDLEVAIEEGSTWIRVGTDLFGARV